MKVANGLFTILKGIRNGEERRRRRRGQSRPPRSSIGVSHRGEEAGQIPTGNCIVR